MNYFQFFPYTFYLPFILSDIICFDKEKKLTKFDKKSLFLFIKKLKPAIKEANRVGGRRLFRLPTSHTTVRTVRYTAVQST